MNIKHDPLP